MEKEPNAMKKGALTMEGEKELEIFIMKSCISKNMAFKLAEVLHYWPERARR